MFVNFLKFLIRRLTGIDTKGKCLLIHLFKSLVGFFVRFFVKIKLSCAQVNEGDMLIVAVL